MVSDRLRICYVSEYFFPRVAGGENWMLGLATEMARRGHEVHVVTSRLPGTRAVEQMSGFTIHRPFASGGFLARLRFMRRLRPFLQEFIRKKKIDLLHNNAYIPTRPCGAAARQTGIPNITSIHLSVGLMWYRITNPISATINMLSEVLGIALSHHDAIHVIARSTERRVGRHTNTPIRYIPNFLDEKKFRRALAKTKPAAVRKRYGIDGRFLLFIGSLLPVKNIVATTEELIRIHERNAKEQSAFVIAGDGPQRAALERLAKRAPPNLRIVLAGVVDEEEKLGLMASCDCFLLCSRSEQLPLTILEALAYSRPVIATGVGGIPDIKRAGFPIRIIKSVGRLEKALKQVKQKQAAIDKSVFATYNLKSVCDQFLKMYRKLLE